VLIGNINCENCDENLYNLAIVLKGFVPGIKMKAVLPGIGATVVDPKKGKAKNTVNVNNLHKFLGHCGEATARLMGKALGYEVII
jgi:hypothetical protein